MYCIYIKPGSTAETLLEQNIMKSRAYNCCRISITGVVINSWL